MIAVNRLHIELTNICTLKCPGCARTTFINKFGADKFPNYNLEYDHLVNFLQDIDLNKKKIELCGNYGDPIYHKDIFKFIDFFKSKNAQVTIITNGSYKDSNFWQNLASILTEQDTVIFSIDGTAENFNQYRINGDWQSIEIGLSIIGNSIVNSVWKTIPFNYNEQQLDEIKILAKKYNIKKFFLDPSDRWDENTNRYKPVKFSGYREQAQIIWRQKINDISIEPKCYSGTEHYISAEGYYTPCCYVHDWRFYFKSEFYKNKKNFSISNNKLKQILKTTASFFDSIETTKPNYCSFSCPKL